MVLPDEAIIVLGPMHAQIKHILQHEQVPMCDTIVLMEVA
jgi:hypothetical protein